MVHEFPNIFSEVLPGCHLTAMLSSWSSWFLVNHHFSKNLCWILLSYLVKLNNKLESWKIKALPNLVHSEGICLCLCVCWGKMISSLIDPRDQLLDLLSCPNFDLSVGYPQIKSEPMMFVMLSYSRLIPRAYTITSLAHQCYHLVHIVVEFHLHGNLDDLLLSPSAIFSSCPWFMLNIKLVLETLKAFLHASSWSICLV